MGKLIFTTSAAPRQVVAQQINCIFCNNSGYVPHPVFKERRMPCACQMKRLAPVPEVMTLVEAIKARRKQQCHCQCQTHDHRPSVSDSDDAAAVMTSQSLTKRLQSRRANCQCHRRAS